MNSDAPKIDQRKICAAQNARDGLINVNDLAALTGVGEAKLTSFAKKGYLTFYGEYHGKRFFKFDEIINWLNQPDQDEAKIVIRQSVDNLLKDDACPYMLEAVSDDSGRPQIRIVWKEYLEEAA
ncbi:MAG: hypothetical protein JO102_06160 [Elusimicrobia bacterium]|nr:hypothetical protein [Elusimicrobiota bacterium]